MESGEATHPIVGVTLGLVERRPDGPMLTDRGVTEVAEVLLASDDLAAAVEALIQLAHQLEGEGATQVAYALCEVVESEAVVAELKRMSRSDGASDRSAPLTLDAFKAPRRV